MKLELKHLAPYLPYGLKIDTSNGGVKIMGFTMIDNELIPQLDVDFEDLSFDNPFKPILRPLSDLTKEIEVEGVSIYPVDLFENELGSIKYESELRNMAQNNYCDWYLPYFIYETLFELHFDLFGLIEKGLAININEL